MSAAITSTGGVDRFEVASSLASRLCGLYGRNSFDGVLVLVPCRDIHTLFMRRPIDVAFVSTDGRVLESYRAVGPNRRLRNPRAVAVLERFSSDAPWFEPGDALLPKGASSKLPSYELRKERKELQ